MGGLFSATLPPIHQACADGNVQDLQALLAAAGDDNSVETLVDTPIGVKSITPLFLAAKCGRVDIVRALLKAGARVDLTVQHNISPLHIASHNGHLSVVQALLAAGADANAQDDGEHAPIEYASVSGHLAVVETLLGASASSDFRTSRALTKALAVAIWWRQLDVVKLLLANGADPSASPENVKGTLLHGAVVFGDVGILQALLDAGADVHAADSVCEGNGVTLLGLASFIGIADVVRLLIRAGAAVNAADSGTDSPLLVACQYHHVETVRVLVEAGADAMHLGSSGYSPLHTVAFGGRDDTMRALLVRNGSSAAHKPVDASVVDKFGTTPLHFASIRGSKAVVKTLLANGASVNAADSDGQTPLDYALYAEQSSVAEILSAAGGTKTKPKRSLLYSASKSGNEAAVALFLRAGVDANVATSNGMTPLHAASMQPEPKIPALLLRGGANIHAMTATGRTPLQIAAKHGHTDVVGTLAKAETLEQQRRQAVVVAACVVAATGLLIAQRRRSSAVRATDQRTARSRER